MPATPAGLVRRFALLSALRWFPVGLTIPVNVLLMQARGLDLAVIGGLYAIYGIVTIALELPTGGLADVVGRRTVLVAASIATTVSLLVAAVAQDVRVVRARDGARRDRARPGVRAARRVVRRRDPRARPRGIGAAGPGARPGGRGARARARGGHRRAPAGDLPRDLAVARVGPDHRALRAGPARRGHDRGQRRRGRPGRPRAATRLGRRPGDRRRRPEHRSARASGSGSATRCCAG